MHSLHVQKERKNNCSAYAGLLVLGMKKMDGTMKNASQWHRTAMAEALHATPQDHTYIQEGWERNTILLFCVCRWRESGAKQPELIGRLIFEGDVQPTCLPQRFTFSFPKSIPSLLSMFRLFQSFYVVVIVNCCCLRRRRELFLSVLILCDHN